MFSATDHPTRPVMVISGPSIRPTPKYPRLPSNRILHRCEDPDADGVLGARIPHDHVMDAGLGEQPP